jgi:uncharacterized membrane protein
MRESKEGPAEEPATKIERVVGRVGWSVGGVAVLAGVASVLLYLRNFRGPFHQSQEVWGQFGDYLGGTLNPIFSLLSLIAILVTLFLQTRELANSSETLKKQSENFKVQAFETSFFTLVGMNSEQVKAIDLEDTEPGTFTGQRAIRKLYQRLEASYNAEVKNSKGIAEDEVVKNAFDQFYHKNQRFVGSYFRSLNQVFRFIMDSSPGEPEQYWKIIQAQMSTYELLLIFYQSFTQSESLDLKLLLDVNYFEFIDTDILLNPKLHSTILKK